MPLISIFSKSRILPYWHMFVGTETVKTARRRMSVERERTAGQAEYWGHYDAGDAIEEAIVQQPAPAASYTIWRLMDEDPTISLVRGILLAELLSIPLSYEADAKTPDKEVELVQSTFDKLKVNLFFDCFQALSMMWQPFEVVWGRDNQDNKVQTLFKPLLPDLTTALTLPTGEVVGLRQYIDRNGKEVSIWGANSFFFANEAPTGQPYGRSRHENCRRQAWWPWLLAMAEGQKIDRKSSGRVFHVMAPPGDESKAKALAKYLSEGKSTYSANFLVPQASGPNKTAINPELAKVSAYNIQQFDLGSHAQAADSIISKLRYYDSMKVRGWRKPERTVLEGQHGTKAESETQTETARSDGELIAMRICEGLKDQVNALLVENFGSKSKDRVRLKPGHLIDRQREWDARLIDAVLSDPQLRGQLAEQVDMDAVFARRGIPKNQGLIKLKFVPPAPEATGAKAKPTNGARQQKEKQRPADRRVIEAAAMINRQFASLGE